MDKRIADFLNKELNRQQTHIELIASENYCSEDVLAVTGSIATNKYAEGYPSRRYYGGCEYIDELENLAINELKKIFNAEYANVQPHSGSQANQGVYTACLEIGDTVVGMDLNAGGHLTHGSSVSSSGMNYNFYHYGVNKDTHLIDFDEIEQLVKKVKPKLIVAGASAYSRIIDWKKFREIADKYNCLLMVDMAHIAGLVAAGVHPSPIPYADFVTSTTHKTLRGPRGAFILAKKEWAKKVDMAIFPGIQGGPLEHVIAAKAQGFIEVQTEEYKNSMRQVVKNCIYLADELARLGYKIISGGTDNHLLIMDVKSTIGITGKKAENILHSVGIVTNKNMIPNDTENAFKTSGIRLGTAAMTTRGFKEPEFKLVAEYIDSALRDSSEENIKLISQKVLELANKFPIYKNIKY